MWMGFWVFLYKKPAKNPRVNASELAYIHQDDYLEEGSESAIQPATEWKLSWADCFRYRQTWSFALGKFLTDGVWWFFLFWVPAYLSSVYDMPSSDPRAQLAIFVLYLISMLSLLGGYLSIFFVNRKGMEPYAGRMRAMLIFAFFPFCWLCSHSLWDTSRIGFRLLSLVLPEPHIKLGRLIFFQL